VAERKLSRSASDDVAFGLQCVGALSRQRLSTARLYIRGICKADLDALYEQHKDPVVNRYLPYETWRDRAAAESWFALQSGRVERGDAFQGVIVRVADEAVIGTCIAFHFGAQMRSAHIGYVLRPAFWGRGFMSEAMRAFVGFLHHDLDLHRLMAEVQLENVASIALLERLAFTAVSNTPDKENLLTFESIRNRP